MLWTSPFFVIYKCCFMNILLVKTYLVQQKIEEVGIYFTFNTLICVWCRVFVVLRIPDPFWCFQSKTKYNFIDQLHSVYYCKNIPVCILEKLPDNWNFNKHNSLNNTAKLNRKWQCKMLLILTIKII